MLLSKIKSLYHRSVHPTAKAGIIVAVSLALGLFFDYLFYGKIPGLSFPIYILLILTMCFVVMAATKRRMDDEPAWLFLPLLFFSGMVFVRSSGLLTFLNIVASLLLLLVIADTAFDKKLSNFLIGDYIQIFFLPFSFIRPMFKTLSDLFLLKGINKNEKVLSQIFKGIAMAVPVLILFLILFSSADLVFHKYLLQVLNINISAETILRIVLVATVSLIFVGAYSYIYRTSAPEANSKNRDRGSYHIGHIENSILLGSVNILFFIFILIQFAYLFGGKSNVTAQGFTYAQYARHGFFELIAVAVFTLLLLLVVEKLIAREETRHTSGFKFLSTFLIVQVVAIMISAFTRLSLYEDAYGFTTLRLYSHAFMIFLAAIFGILLLKILANKKDSMFAFGVFISIISFLFAMNLLNPDAFIAQKNLDRFATTGKLDIVYLSHLSDDALPVTISLLDAENGDVRGEFAREAYQHYLSVIKDSSFANWQSLNISRMRSVVLIGMHIQEFQQLKNYSRTYTNPGPSIY